MAGEKNQGSDTSIDLRGGSTELHIRITDLLMDNFVPKMTDNEVGEKLMHRAVAAIAEDIVNAGRGLLRGEPVTWQEFRDWYDTLSQDHQLRVMRLIADEPFDKSLPKEHERIKQARENIRKKFYEGGGHR